MAKSLPSRTKVEKHVRTKAADASSTTLIRRFQRISSSIASKLEFLRSGSARTFCILVKFLDGHAHGEIWTNRDVRRHGHDNGRLTLFEHERAGERRTRFERVTVVDIDHLMVTLEWKIDLALAAGRRHAGALVGGNS